MSSAQSLDSIPRLANVGTLFYHPDLHTHLSCVRETGNCQLFVLIIGGRFGGSYTVDPTKSITNAEYSSAIQASIPVFCFVKQEVLNDHNLWQRNKTKPFAAEIHYPSIEKQEFATDIFRFIDEVRLAPVNNGLFGFRLAKDIHAVLRKQWAGMMFEYLQTRAVAKQIAVTNESVANVTVLSGKIEELVKKIYINVDASGAPDSIKQIDEEGLAETFLSTVSSRIADRKFVREIGLETLGESFPTRWWQFLDEACLCNIVTEADPADGLETKLVVGWNRKIVGKFDGQLSKQELEDNQRLQTHYSALATLNPGKRTELLGAYMWTKQDSERGKAAIAARAASKRSGEPTSDRPPT